MSRYLITGAQGLLGRHLAARILELERDAEVLGVGRSKRLDGYFTHAISAGGEQRQAPMPTHLIGSFDERYRYRPLSLLETGKLRELIRDFRPGCIFHLASALHSASDRDLFETNAEGTASLMNAVSQTHKALLILGSSASVYGEASSLPISESHPCKPAGIYGLTKLAAEHIARVNAARIGIAVVTARIFNVIGAGQAESHVCGRFAAQLASPPDSRRRVLHVGPLGATRDFIDARDVAAALLLLAQRGEHGGTYNVASGRETTIHSILSELVRISGLGAEVSIAQEDDRPAGVTRHVADVSRLERLGFVPRYSIGESLRDLLCYYQGLQRREAV